MEWEIDFWGRIRRANEAAFAELLATEESRREIYQALVVQVANAYFDPARGRSRARDREADPRGPEAVARHRVARGSTAA